MKKIDCHMHVNGASRRWGWPDNDRIIDTADRLGIEHLCCSIPVVRGLPDPEEIRACNDGVLEAMREYRGRILGYCYVNPGHQRAALEEIDRCMDRGMIGIKLYNQYLAWDPTMYPIYEKAIDLNVPLLWHSGHTLDRATALAVGQPNISDGTDIARAARRYPEAMIIQGHIGGGGDWEWGIKAVRHTPNVYLDTSGSVVDDGMIDMAVREIGADRLLFGTDMTMEGGVGKIEDAHLTKAQKEKIYWSNMAGILKKGGYFVP
jgi:predicted TIM-barrel fold metal-dependent hydrolase